MKKVITLMAAFGLFICMGAQAQSNATPAAKPQAATTAEYSEAVITTDSQSDKKDKTDCKGKGASCCKNKSGEKGKACCKGKAKSEMKEESK